MYYECGMCFAGVWDNGDDDYYEFGSMSSTEARNELPVELDEAYGITEYLEECEAQEETDEDDEENIDIDLDGGLSATNE